MPRETIDLGGTAAAGASGQITKQIWQPAKITKVTLRFYPGPELALRVTPYILWREFLQPIVRRGDGQPTYLAGENDLMEFDCDFPIEPGATLVAAWVNTDAVNPYDFSLPIILSPRTVGR